jgi:predicted anti-sigma-YlaC factor YlaD
MKTKRMKCTDVVDHICNELDTRLSSAKCREIKKHLAKCPNCTAYLDSLKKTIRLYSTYPHPRVPRKTRKKLFAVLKLQE